MHRQSHRSTNRPTSQAAGTFAAEGHGRSGLLGINLRVGLALDQDAPAELRTERRKGARNEGGGEEEEDGGRCRGL